MPAISGLAFEAHQGMIRGAAALARIVPDVRFFLVPVQGQDRRVQVEQHAAQRLGALAQFREQAIMQVAEFREATQGEAVEKPSQRSGIRVSRQPGQGLEDPVVAQQLSRLDAAQPKDDRIQQSEQHLRNTVGVVALRETYLSVEVLAQMQPVKETLEEKDASVSRQMIAGEGDPDVLGTAPVAHGLLPRSRILGCPLTYRFVRLSGSTQIPSGRAAERPQL